MGEFLKPLRHKMGVAVLGVACVFTAAWVRSIVSSDYVRFFPVQFHGILIVSREQEIVLQVWSGANLEKQKSKRGKKKPEYQPERLGIHLNEPLTRRMALGSGIATVFQPEAGRFKRYREYKVPYWSIVLPLTMTSAYLLLGIFRKGGLVPKSKV